MYKSILMAIFGVFAVLCVAQMTIADTPNTGSDTLDTIIFKSDQAFKDVHQGFLNLAGVQTDTQFKKKVEDGFRQSGEVLSNKLKAFKEETKAQTGKTGDLYREFYDKISNDIEKFKSSNPDFSGKSKEYQDGIERRYKLVVDEARNLQNKLKTENSQMTEKTKQQLNDIVQGTINDANALKQQLQTTKKN